MSDAEFLRDMAQVLSSPPVCKDVRLTLVPNDDDGGFKVKTVRSVKYQGASRHVDFSHGVVRRIVSVSVSLSLSLSLPLSVFLSLLCAKGLLSS